MLYIFWNKIGRLIKLIFFILLVSCNSININDYNYNYYYEIQNRKDEQSRYDDQYLFIYRQNKEQKILIDSMPILREESNINYYFNKNNFYIYYQWIPRRHLPPSFTLIKYEINNDSLISINRLDNEGWLNKNCHCLFENNTATITCDSTHYDIDLEDLELK